MKKLLYLLLLLGTASLRATPTDADALAFLKAHAPSIHAQVAALEKLDPQDYRSALDEAKTATLEHAKLLATKETSAAAAYVKMYVADFAAISAADALLAAKNDDEQQKLTITLKNHIAASLEQWAIVEQARIRRLESELAKLKAELQQALADKQKVIDNDAATLIEECRTYQKTKEKTAK